MTSSEENQASRKRPRKSVNTVESSTGGQKARGRPRVDTQDATATERRRTQIRIAQRAYRQRKETTIVSLKAQSSHLCSIIEQMNKTFRRLNESALHSGLLQLNPGLAQEFADAAETFSGLLKTANEGQYDGDEEQGDAADNSYEQTEKRPRHTPVQTELEHLGWGYSVSISTPKVDSLQQPHDGNTFSHASESHGNSVPTSSLVRHRQSAIGDILDRQNIPVPEQVVQDQTPSPSHQLPFGLVEILSPHHALYTTMSPKPHIQSVSAPTPEVTPPMTRLSPSPAPCSPIPTGIPWELRGYSFEETTFARRLTRRTLEAGFELLSKADVRPAALNRVFQLSLPFLTPGQIRARFRNVLSRGIDDDLDWWETPFIQVGGAGTHYPPRDAVGRALPLKNAWRVRQTGSSTKRSTQLENALDGRLETLNGVDLSGLEGQWFDAHDVQGYLEEVYACKVDPGSSLAECLIEDDISDNITDQSGLSSHFDATTRRASSKSQRSCLGSSSTSSSISTPSVPSSLITDKPSKQPGGLPDTVHFGLDTNFTQKPIPNHGGQFQKLVGYDVSLNHTLGLGLMPEYGFGIPGGSRLDMVAKDLEMDVLGREMVSPPVVRQKRERIVTINVDRLINEMIRRCVCLGRAPGFRQKDVDIALRAAIISSC